MKFLPSTEPILPSCWAKDAAKDMPAWTVVIVNRGADKAEIAYKKQDTADIAKRLGGKLMTGIKGRKERFKHDSF